MLQDTVLFTGSVRDNIAYGTDATPEQVVEAARAAAAHEFIERLPDGYDTELGPQGAGLSGGQRQRIGIARTLLRDPPVIVLDEPTTALDRESEEQVMQGLDRLMRGRTCILITHSPRLARAAGRVITLEHGRIVRRRCPCTSGCSTPASRAACSSATTPRSSASRTARAARGGPLPHGRRRRRAQRGRGRGSRAARMVRLAPQFASYDPDEDVLVTWLPSTRGCRRC